MTAPSSSAPRKEFPRKLLVQILGEVLSQGHALDQTLDDAFSKNPKLSGEQRAWLKEVASGTLRWKGRLDAAIDQAAFRKKPTGRLRRILLAAAYGVVVQDRVASARVVDEWVGFIRELEGIPPSRFANAVLRRISETSDAWRGWEFPEGATAAEKARWASLPEWFWSRLVSERGEAWAREYAVASLERPQLWLRRKPGAAGSQVSGLSRCSESLPASAWERAAGAGPVTEIPGFGAGEWLVQDVSSQVLVDEVSKKVRSERTKASVLSAWDVCAAPGGKTVALSWNGFRVSATDKAGQRLMLLQETVRRCAGDAGIEVRALGTESTGGTVFDLVWVDAPCTGSGILRRHPDVRWLRKAEDVDSLRKLQREILADSWKSVPEGGFLAYSVCSIFPSELASLADAIDAGDYREVCRWDLSPQGAPHGDGFQCVLIQRTASRSRIS